VGTGGSGEVDPLEVLAALRWNAPLGFSVTAGGGAGLSSGYGTPNYRFVASVGFAPWAQRAEVGAQRAAPAADEPPAVAPPAAAPAAATPSAEALAASPVPPPAAPVEPAPPAPAPAAIPSPEATTAPASGATPRPEATLVERRIEVPEAVYFAVNKADLDPKSHALLDDVAAIMRANPEVRRLRIEGNASKDPLADTRKDGAEYNRKLSAARAEAVEAYLVRQGVEGSRLESIGHGWDRPVAPNDTKEGRARNRRTDLVVFDQ
jgi:outer membrane protein OmpA-like peptidoglycan-associated protein